MPDFLRWGEGRSGEQVLSHDECAKALRDTSLDLLQFGTNGSRDLIPTSHTKEAVKLASLLQYSGDTKKHLQTLTGVLQSPREFQIVETPHGIWHGDEADGDVIHHTESIGDVYEFAHHLTSPYLNAFAAGLDQYERNEPYLSISIMRLRSGIWQLSYIFSEWLRYTMVDPDYVEGSYPFEKRGLGIGGAPFMYPERKYLLNFVYSPKQLQGQWFINQSISPSVMPYVYDKGKKMIGPYAVTTIGFDATGLERQLAREDREDPRTEILHTQYALERYCLQRDGDREYTIVDLGKAAVGSQIYHVYSGSEQPLAKEFIADRSKTLLRVGQRSYSPG